MAVFPFTGPEGLGIVVAEAQACGCPVVVSNIPAMADLVQAGRTGIVVTPGDVDGLVGALSSLIGDPDQGRALAQAARTLVERKFGWSEVGARYQEIVRKLVSSSNSQPK
jgi:glycosyltransferase involved in cell wall biosynthesis